MNEQTNHKDHPLNHITGSASKHIEDDVISEYPDKQHIYQTSFENRRNSGMFTGLDELHDTEYDDYWQTKPHWRSKRQTELFKSRAPPTCRRFARRRCR